MSKLRIAGYLRISVDTEIDKDSTSIEDILTGIGAVKKRALLDKFKDLSGIISATKEDLLTVEGIGEKHADAILEKLKEEKLI